jgi:MoxR-like ATPase
LSDAADLYELEQRSVSSTCARAATGSTPNLSKVIVGQKEAVEQLLISLFAGGHCLITGAPGPGQDAAGPLDRADLSPQVPTHPVHARPDAGRHHGHGNPEKRPAKGRRMMQFVKGPIFANVILADEINRTPPKTQAALLEAMQEHQVTAAGVRYPLEEPFFVLATQNPIEMEGTYPLPEAQLDRFMFNVVIDYLPEDDEVEVVTRTTSPATGRSSRSSPGRTCCAFTTWCAASRSPKTWCATPCGWPPPAGRCAPSRPTLSTTG